MTKKKPIDRVRIRELYDEGMTDKGISRALQVAPVRVWEWRTENGLPSNSPHRPKASPEQRAALIAACPALPFGNEAMLHTMLRGLAAQGKLWKQQADSA